MTLDEAIAQLKLDRDLCNFNPMTGEEEPMNEDCRKSAEALDIAIKALEQESKTGRWIPCSERLPEKCGQYLATRGPKTCGNLWNRVYIVNYSDLMGLRKERIWWSGDVRKIDFEIYDDVLAWMPLPEPYKTESEE